MKSRLHTKVWFDARTAWRWEILSQVKQWVEENDQGPYDKVTHNIVVRRIAWLEQFIYFFFPDAPPAPFAAYDAASLILLPRYAALRLARRLFFGSPGFAGDLEAEDLKYNMDWFRPKGWQ